MENISNYYQIIFKRLFNISANILEEYRFLLTLEKMAIKHVKNIINTIKFLKNIYQQKNKFMNLLKKTMISSMAF